MGSLPIAATEAASLQLVQWQDGEQGGNETSPWVVAWKSERMHLSIEFIAEKLRRTYDRVSVQSTQNAPKFATARIFNRAQASWPSSSSPLIIASASNAQPGELTQCAGIIWIGEGVPPDNAPAILVPDETDLLAILDRVLTIMEYYSNWSENVRNALLEQKPIASVVCLLGEATDNPYWYGDAALRVVAMSKSSELETLSPIWRHQVEHGRYSADTLSKLISTGDLERINSRDSAWVFENSATYEGPFVSKTIVCNGNVYGYVFIIEVDGYSEVCDTEILEEFGNLISGYVEHSRVSAPASNRIADQMLKECLLGSMAEPSDLNDLADLLNWNVDDEFIVTAFETASTGNPSKETMKAQMRMLEDNLPGRVILLESCVLLISNATELAEPDLKETLTTICKRLGWKAGMSNRFKGLGNVGSCNQQAKIALRIGSAQRPDEIIHTFSYASIFYLCEQLSRQVSESLLIHQGVCRLAAMDEKADGDLLDTLDVYLNNERSVAKTASCLYLHRNSVGYRIDKIKSILNEDLEDSESRLNIILSIRLWKYLHPKNSEK